MIRTAILLLALPLLALAQGVTPGPTQVVPVIRGTAAPLPTPCTDGLIRYDTTAGAWKKCSSNAWVSAAGAGTVTSVSGTSPVSVSSGTTTPVVSVADATGTTKGVVQVGTGLSVTSGTVSVAYGTTSGTAAQGNDARLSDARTPTTHASTHAAAGSDPVTLSSSQVSGLGTAATKNVGTTTGTVAAGDDSRLSDARTPTAHATSHGLLGGDTVSLDASQLASGTLATARLGSGSASSSTYLRGDSTWATVGGGGMTRTAVTGATTLSGTGDLYADVTISANATLTLPAATTAGQRVIVADTGRNLGSSYLLKIAGAGSDTIDGASAIILDDDGAGVTLVSDGTSKWTVAGAVGAWGIDPRSISGIRLWVDAGRGVTLSGTKVSAWSDLSGVGTNLAQATSGSQPFFDPSGFGGRPALRFAGSQTIGAASVSVTSGAATLFGVVSTDWTTAGSRDALTVGNTHSSNAGIDFNIGCGTVDIYQGPNIAAWGQGYSQAPKTTLNAVSWILTNQARVVTWGLGASAAYVRLDGYDLTTSSSAGAVPSYSAVALTVGGVPAGGTLTGRVLALVLVDGAVTGTTRTLVEAYLRRKFGI